RTIPRPASPGSPRRARPGCRGRLVARSRRPRSVRRERMSAMKFAQRMSEIGTETAFEVLARARKLEAQGRNIVHLEIGEPDFPTPPNIVEAAEKAVRDGYTHYTPAGGTPVPIALRERNDFRLDIEELKGKITPRTRLIVINSPQNPTGGVLTTRDLEQIAELARKHDLYILSDEVYGQITYDGTHASILTMPGMVDRVIYSD